MNYKAVILDDEIHCSDGLKMQIQELFDDVEIIQTFNSSEQALEYLLKEDNQFIDILFLDVEMPRLNGLDFLKKLGKINFNVVFTTAYDQFAIQAFRFSALDYLLKPIEDNDLIMAIDKLRQKNNIKGDHDRINYLLEQYGTKKLNKIVISTSEGYELLEVDQIIHCKSDSNYSEIHLENGKTLVASKTLKEFDEMLSNKGFLRIHNSHLVNLEKVKKILKADGGYVEMSNGDKLGISRNRKEELFKFLEHIKNT